MHIRRYYSGNAFIKLPFSFDPLALKEDYERCLRWTFQPHFNQRDYEGTWTAIYLRSVGGKLDNHAPEGDRASFLDTELMAGCPSIRAAMEVFQCPKHAIRIMNLRPGSRILPHRDNCLGYEDGVFRVHIPICTNTQVDFFVENHRLPMAEGESWYVNFNLVHHVENRSNADRVHLVADMERNAWTDALFGNLGYDFEREATPPPMSSETLQKVIAELELRHDPLSLQLLKELKNQHLIN